MEPWLIALIVVHIIGTTCMLFTLTIERICGEKWAKKIVKLDTPFQRLTFIFVMLWWSALWPVHLSRIASRWVMTGKP